MKNNIARFDYGSVKGDALVSPEGYIKANAIVTRTGIFEYQNLDGTIRKELRHPDDVWNLDSIKSLEMIPVTNGHPRDKMVTPENFKKLAIGFTGQNINKDGDFVLSNFVINDQEGIDAVIKHGRKELSLGYFVDLDETKGVYNNEHYDARQTNIRYNHLAIVDKARAGKEARIALDSNDAIEFLKGDKIMSMRKIKIDDQDMEVEKSVGDYLDKLQEDLKNLQEERDRVEAEIKLLQDKYEKALAEKDNMSSQIDEMKSKNTDSDDKFKKAVKERVALESVAKNMLSSSTLSKLDSLSNNEIKKEVIKISRKSISLDGKSQTYIDVMYDTILEEKTNKKPNLDNVLLQGNENNDGENPLVKARLNMIKNQKNQNKMLAVKGEK